MLFLTRLLLVALLSGPCIPQNQEEFILTLKSIAAKQDGLLQQIDVLEDKLLAQQELFEDELLAQQEQLENLALSSDRCSTEAQISTFQDLLATDACERTINKCSIYATCRESPIHSKCSCMAGYSGDGVICEDIDECKDDSNVCGDEKICINLPGNHTCICQDGYEKQGDICQDIDECKDDSNVCGNKEACINLPGKYTCICYEGYERQGGICQGFVCTSPKLQLQPLGCISLVMDYSSWSDAQAKCKAVGGSLLNGFTTQQQLITIVQHIRQHFDIRAWSAWVGIQGGLFVNSPSDDDLRGGTPSTSPVDTHLWSKGEPIGAWRSKTRCGVIYLLSYDEDPFLWDSDCSTSQHPFLCQVLY